MNDGRQTMVQRLKLVERERDGLEGARAAAEAYMGKERECTNAQCTIYQVGKPYLAGRVSASQSQPGIARGCGSHAVLQRGGRVTVGQMMVYAGSVFLTSIRGSALADGVCFGLEVCLEGMHPQLQV